MKIVKKDSNIINATELSIILDIYKSTMYYLMHPEKKKAIAIKKATKENRILSYKIKQSYYEKFKKVEHKKSLRQLEINIDEFLKAHKISDKFKFRNEEKGDSFIKRMEINVNHYIKEYPEWLTTKELRQIVNYSQTKLKSLRDNELIYYKTITDERYKPNAKGRIQYLYSRDSIIKYLENNEEKTLLQNRKSYIFEKQFITPKEVKKYIADKYNCDISLTTIYRNINLKEVPAIKIGSMIKIPILEFTEDTNIKEIFNIE